MATYGYTPAGAVNFTGYTNVLGVGPANQASQSGQVYFNGITQGDDRIAKMLRNGGQTLTLRALLAALTGIVAGGTVTVTRKQVQGQQGAPGGLQTIETVTAMNRTTTAADVTMLNALFIRNVFPSSYVADLSGNGGGGKASIAGGGMF